MAEAVIPEWTLADHLRKARQITRLSQREFAEHIGVTASSYAQWEAGNNRPRDVVMIAKRIELLTGIPASWTLDVTPWRPPDPYVASVVLGRRGGVTDETVSSGRDQVSERSSVQS